MINHDQGAYLAGLMPLVFCHKWPPLSLAVGMCRYLFGLLRTGRPKDASHTASPLSNEVLVRRIRPMMRRSSFLVRHWCREKRTATRCGVTRCLGSRSRNAQPRYAASLTGRSGFSVHFRSRILCRLGPVTGIGIRKLPSMACDSRGWCGCGPRKKEAVWSSKMRRGCSLRPYTMQIASGMAHPQANMAGNSSARSALVGDTNGAELRLRGG